MEIPADQMKTFPGPGIFALLPSTDEAVRAVIDLVVLEDAETLHAPPDYDVVPVSTEVRIGWLYDGEHFAEA